MDTRERVATALACSAVDPALAGLLFYDLDPAHVYPLARWIAELLGSGTRIFPISPEMVEDTLWQRFTLNRNGTEDLGLQWAPGPLAGYDRPPGIVAVPNLSVAGLSIARAGVALIGADVAYLQREGVSREWRPKDRWLAALPSADIGRISPHLLDRFAIRIHAGDLRLSAGETMVLPEAEAWQAAVRRGAERLPPLSAAAAELVIAAAPASTPGLRRELAVGRLARAIAALDGDPEVLPDHVARATTLAGLRSATVTRGDVRPARPDRQQVTAEPASVPDQPGPLEPAAQSRPDREREHHPAAAGPEREDGVNGYVGAVPGRPAALSAEPAGDLTARRNASSFGPYLEDQVRSARESASLRIGWRRPLTGPPRGQPIGTERTRDRRDVAVAATLFNAARYQRLRCDQPDQHYQLGHRLHVRPDDLLSYRRAPRPGRLLVLVLDHTCRAEDWNWYEPLAPYLRWAYVNRALVGVVEVGAPADDPRSELRATQFRSRKVLHPRVAAALRRRPGRATPLAHGLTLAGALLRQYAQQPGLTDDAFLVVVTDGRANVPLAASQTATPPASAVGLTAVEDAERAARAIGKLRRVRRVVIDPGTQPGRHLATQLAVALTAPLVSGASATDPADLDDGAS